MIGLPVAAGLALGGASLAVAAPDAPSRPEHPLPERPALVQAFAGPPPALLPEPAPFGLHRELAEDMAKELGLPAERVVDAMRKAIAAEFDRRRDEALKCFEDRKQCAAAAPPGLFPLGPGIEMPPRGRLRTP